MKLAPLDLAIIAVFFALTTATGLFFARRGAAGRQRVGCDREGDRSRATRGEIQRNTIAWILGIALVYAIMFGTGALTFGQPLKFSVFAAIALISGLGLVFVYRAESAEAS